MPLATLQRQQIIDLLYRHTTSKAKETWLPLIQHSLSQGTEIVSPHDADVTIVTSHDGIPQGDPLSTLLFSSAMALILEEWSAFVASTTRSSIIEAGPHHNRKAPFVVSYVDDTIIATDVTITANNDVVSYKSIWTSTDWQLQTDKTRIWGPAMVRADPQTARPSFKKPRYHMKALQQWT